MSARHSSGALNQDVLLSLKEHKLEEIENFKEELTSRSKTSKIADILQSKVVTDMQEIQGFIPIQGQSSSESETPIRRYIDSDEENDRVIQEFKKQEKERLKKYKVVYNKTRSIIDNLDNNPFIRERKVKRLQDSFNISMELQSRKKLYKKSIEDDYQKKLHTIDSYDHIAVN